jgi:hypothetical protein
MVVTPFGRTKRHLSPLERSHLAIFERFSQIIWPSPIKILTPLLASGGASGFSVLQYLEFHPNENVLKNLHSI